MGPPLVSGKRGRPPGGRLPTCPSLADGRSPRDRWSRRALRGGAAVGDGWTGAHHELCRTDETDEVTGGDAQGGGREESPSSSSGAVSRGVIKGRRGGIETGHSLPAWRWPLVP